jgi:hypothetical protein
MNDSDCCNKAALPETDRCYRNESEIALSIIETVLTGGVRFITEALMRIMTRLYFFHDTDNFDYGFVLDTHCCQTIYSRDAVHVRYVWQ